MKDLFRGFGLALSGLGLIRQPGLRRFVAIPLAVNVLLFAVLIGLAANAFGHLVDSLIAALPQWLGWLEFLLWPLFALSALLVLLYGFVLLANLIAAPFNGLLAEAVERQLTGQSLEGTGGLRQILADILPSLGAELVKLRYMAVRALPLAVLFLIPGLNLVAPFAWGLFSAWMLALEYADYPMANHRIFFPEQRQRLGRRPLLTLGFGGGALLLTLVPVLNFVAMPAAVAGATALWVRELAGGSEE